MRTRILMMLAAALAAVVPAFAEDFSLPVGQFSKISVDDKVNVIYIGGDGSPSRVRYEGDRKFAKAFIISHSGDKLRVQVETEFVDDPQLPTIYLYSDFLKSASNSSDGTLKIESAAPTSEISFTVMGNGTIVADSIRATKVSASIKSGNGTIAVSGHCQNANFTMIGNGTIQADHLEATVVNCKMLGNGSIGCWAVNDLKLRGIGSTKVYYKGNPEIDKKGGGKVFQLEWDRKE